MLRVVGDAIAMHGLLWPDEVRVARGGRPRKLTVTVPTPNSTWPTP